MPTLTGADDTTFTENTVNTAPQVIDTAVVFTDAEGDFDGGTLTVSGLLTEDTVSVRNQGTGAGQIGLSGANVTYAGVVIGTLSGGVGGTLTITFNANATSAAIDALLQNLTYANGSDTPTETRTLSINVTDAAGHSLSNPATFTELYGTANPFDGLFGLMHPVLADLDNDGDADLIAGAGDGSFLYYENTGSSTSPSYVWRWGGDNPLDGLSASAFSAPAFADVDNDGDLDMVSGNAAGGLVYFRNDGTASTPDFVMVVGAGDPFSGLGNSGYSTPAFADLDNDGDFDLVIGNGYNDGLFYVENTGTVGAPVFEGRTGSSDPFNGISLGSGTAPAFADVDGDGDLDAMVGNYYGHIYYLENTGTASSPSFSPSWAGIDVGYRSGPIVADIDGDGDIDLGVADNYGQIHYLRNGPSITVTVTAEDDAPYAAGLPTDVSVTAETASNLDLSGVTLTDPDTTGQIIVQLTVTAGALAGVQTGGVNVSSFGTIMYLSGTASDIDAWLNDPSHIQYTGPAGVTGDDAVTLTVATSNSFMDSFVTRGTVNIDIVGPNHAPTLTGVATSASFNENTVNATPQLLDADVTFDDEDDNFDGGTLTVSGLLAEDRVSIASGDTISLSAGTVYYDADGATGSPAVAIGTASGGSGATFTVTFNADATSAAIDALIQSLTYANVSNTPTASRDLVINVTDAAGESLDEGLSFTQHSGAANPLDGVDTGSRNGPALADLDGDGDVDLVVGDISGTLRYFENTGTVAAPVFAERTGAANPFDGLDIGHYSRPALADLDGDGDKDVIVGDYFGVLQYLENTGTAFAPVFTHQIGPTNPFDGLSVTGYQSAPTLADLDGDGDLDAVVGEYDGALNYFENTGTAVAPVFTQRTGAANPFDGLSAGTHSTPVLVDVDGDGDLDLVSGYGQGGLRYFENTGTSAAPVFIQRTGADNPFDGVDVGYISTPGFADLDGDGDLDIVIGDDNALLGYVENTTQPPGRLITVTVTAQNDAPAASGLPTDVTVTEDVASNLDLSAVTLADLDGDTLTVVLTASAGTMTATSGGGVTVSDSGTGAITLAGTASAIDAFLNTASAIQYTGAANASGNNAATVTITANDGSGAVTLGTVNIDITNVDDPMSLTGLVTTASFNENTVNATPQLLDADVTFDHADNDYDGGTLTVSGLLAEDRVSIASGDTISLSSGAVYYDADGAGGSSPVAIGTASGGSGATFTVTFNADATSEAIDALLQSLTYANVSNAPTASRDLVINVTDAAGEDLFGAPTFTARTGGANPLNGKNLGSWTAPAFADLDGDGDLDLVSGDSFGELRYLENTGTASAPVFTLRTGAANPFNGFDLGERSTPAAVDLDGDGDFDVVVGEVFGALFYFENTGTASTPAFTLRSGGANPLNGIDVGFGSTPAFVDLDGDGDLDLVSGEAYGAVRYYENTGTASAAAFTARTGAANPFNGVDLGDWTSPAFADLDNDGDLDAAVGEYSGAIFYFENTGTAAAPVFTLRTGTANPLAGAGFGYRNTPAFGDLDGDGDLDTLIGSTGGPLNYHENTTPLPPTITVTVTAQNDAPAASGLPTDVTVTEDVASNLDLSAVTLADLDGDTLTVVLTASAGTMTATSGGGVTVSDSGTGAITLTGTASAIDTFLNTASAVQYTGASNANGNDAATVTITANDGSGAVTLGTVNIDITAVNDAMTLTGFGPSVTFAENTVNAAPQLLDIDVVFTDPDSFTGGTLILSGLLAEDTVSVRNQGTGAGEIGLSGGNVTYGGVVIGTLAGGVGGALTITFNAAATGTAIDALIQNLTYANSSNTPTASRTLTINVTDASGDDLRGALAFTERTGAANPFNGVNVGSLSAPALVDLDGDGDLDAVIGEFDGSINYFENTGTASAAVFTPRTGAANPFNGVSVGFSAGPSFADLDGDGDLDAVVGSYFGVMNYFENTGSASSPVFVARSGAANPFNGVDLGHDSKPTLADVDADGDVDAIIGERDGVLNYFENTGTASAPVFTQRTGLGNPFDGVDTGFRSAPRLADLDGDGDLDVLIGDETGVLFYFENTGTTSAPVFTQRTGAANPFNGVDLGSISNPTLADLDGDGDLDVLVGENDGPLNYFENTTIAPPSITVTVTAEADGPTNGPDTLTGTSGAETVSGGGGNDTLDGGDGDDVVDGGTGDDTMVGGAGADTLKGGTGADSMAGGLGDDIYVVDDGGDVVDETGGDGTDTVRSSITYTLTTGVENLVLMFKAAINGTGNALANVITGNTGANTLYGLAGEDTLNGDLGDDTLWGGDDNDVLSGGAGRDILYGEAGDDTLDGSAGADRLDGGTGADTMTGGAGGDTYVVDDAGDVIVEAADGGTDTVEASATYSLAADLENLLLTGGAAINGTGNGLANVLTGNGAANTLTGAAGKDTLDGAGGNDVLIGGAGADTLTGGTGADIFRFTSADFAAKAETDRILDLNFADGDVIDLSLIDANSVLGGDQAFSFVGKFTKSAGQAVVSFAGGVTTVAFDVNGDGKADFKITLTGDHRGTTGNLYTGGGDTDGGWLL